ncbi:hypothetical protein [Allostreptomyces psammosilenae]|uniref:Secreted protein n=1 Tax=Allostreptomyces psammosilenae TaxID=1892865 RepID=A0A853A3X0_9ACTN|nr:hypothetical protein [Allostreptomyces psammosilenae]NYI08170.1 hypothetical protein [Allostreptomyces psammosilenae]
MPLHPALAAAGAGALLALALPVDSASAAAGFFSYTTADAGRHVILDPADHVCHALSDGAQPASLPSNQTDRVAHLYLGLDCSGGLVAVMQPYTSSLTITADSLRYY